MIDFSEVSSINPELWGMVRGASSYAFGTLKEAWSVWARLVDIVETGPSRNRIISRIRAGIPPDIDKLMDCASWSGTGPSKEELVFVSASDVLFVGMLLHRSGRVEISFGRRTDADPWDEFRAGETTTTQTLTELTSVLAVPYARPVH